MVELIQALQSLAQAGLAYTKDPFDRQRFDAIQKLAIHMLEYESGLSHKQAAALILDETGYRTPKVDVRAGIFQSDTILLVRERSDGLWCLPGGWADINETPSAAIIREVFEESGLETRPRKLVAVHDTNLHGPRQFYHSYKLLFLCEIIQGELRETLETSAARFFPREALPPLSERRTTAAQIALLFDHRQNIESPTAFD